jgi:hypothetical protein
MAELKYRCRRVLVTLGLILLATAVVPPLGAFALNRARDDENRGSSSWLGALTCFADPGECLWLVYRTLKAG